MSHYYAIAVLPPTTADIEGEVARMMEPHRESDDLSTGWWDWFQIGGRWTGRLDNGYDPRTDPRNIETCRLCRGTGTRLDIAVANGCNGCRGVGSALKWPTEWVAAPGNKARWADVAESVKLEPPYTVVYPEGAAHHEIWDGDAWVEVNEIDAALSSINGDAIVVVVDYHS